MKLLGLIGGVAPESAAICHRRLDERARRDLNSDGLTVCSFDFDATGLQAAAADCALGSC